MGHYKTSGESNSMDLITKRTPKNLEALLLELIEASEKIVLVSGWLKWNGFKEVKASLFKAVQREGTTVALYSNKKHTEKSVINALKKVPKIKHFIARESTYLHTKLFYFEKGSTFTAIVGSANITKGGLKDNEELSLKLEGEIGSPMQKEIWDYIESLEKHLKEHKTS